MIVLKVVWRLIRIVVLLLVYGAPRGFGQGMFRAERHRHRWIAAKC